MGIRRQAREAALQAIFRCDFLNDWNSTEADICLHHFAQDETIQCFSTVLCKGLIDNLLKIDTRITRASENWSLSRMSRVDRSIIRLATFEIVYLEEVPINVSINEAIEVAKKYGADESSTFVNGVLDKVAFHYRNEQKQNIEVENISTESSFIEPSYDVEKLVVKN